ncbi:LptE family protein [Anaerophaga thermohalophila]|uniref:LptE family protein n=1 Tax=Anaerophaga thermohalophila TaxID=177400 RepID=UPI000474A0B8|nr:LptE family protein [Anaerophaga thermohalophila]
MNKHQIKSVITKSMWVLVVSFLMHGCAIQMTFDGASIPENVHTASVQTFDNRAAYINPVLSQTLTEALKDRVINGSRLTLAEETGDVDFSGEITGYETEPLAIQADAVSAETRLTVRINVRYENFKDPEKSWESSFSAYRDFPSEQNITAIEGELVSEIVEELTDNIFNKAFADW